MEFEPQSNPIEMEFALNQLADKNAERREWAEDRVRQMSALEVSELIEKVKEEGAKRKRRRRVVLCALSIYISILSIWILWYLALGLWTGKWGDSPFSHIMLFNVVGCFGWFIGVNGAQRDAARALAIFNHRSAVGVYAEAIEYYDPNVAKIARDALLYNLPSLKASDSYLLTSEQRACLHRVLLKPDKDFALGMAILASLDQVGDDRDIAAVKKLSDFEAATPNQKKLREEARRILPGLGQRAELSKASRTLLRASTSSSDPVVSLLRPASAGNGIAEDRLLRPTTDC